MKRIFFFVLLMAILLVTSGLIAYGEYNIINDRDRDGIGDQMDRCPDIGEIVNGINDHDGCPDTLFIRVLGEIKGGKGIAIVTVEDLSGKRVSFKIKGSRFEWVTNVPQVYSLSVKRGKCLSDKINLFLRRGEIVKVSIPLKCPSPAIGRDKTPEPVRAVSKKK